jgi:hypothetical protein
MAQTWAATWHRVMFWYEKYFMESVGFEPQTSPAECKALANSTQSARPLNVAYNIMYRIIFKVKYYIV